MRKETFKIILVLILGNVPLIGKETYTLRFAHPDPAMMDNPHHIMVVKAKKLIEARSNGRINVDIYPSKQLGSDMETILQVQGGILEASVVYPQSMVAIVPEIQVLGIPYLFNVPGYDPDEVILEVMKGQLVDRLAEKLAAELDNVQLISPYGNDWRDFATTFPVKSIDDLQGSRIRTIPSPIQQSLIKNVGAEPAIVDSSEVFMALGTGLIDGAKYGVLQLYSIRIVDFIKYVFVDHHVPILCYIVANRKWLDSLPQELREIVINGLKDSAEFGTRNATRLNRKLSIRFEEKDGGNIYKPSEKELRPFRQAAEPIKKFFTEKYGREWLDLTLSAVEEAKKRIEERKNQ